MAKLCFGSHPPARVQCSPGGPCLGFSNAVDRTAKATEETARNTKRLVTEFSGDGELEFA